MTMSTSSAPASTAARVSASLISRNVWPLGNPVATLATFTSLPFRASFASATIARTYQLVGPFAGEGVRASGRGHGTERIRLRSSEALSLAPAVDLRQRRHPALALDKEVAEPVEDDAQVLDPPERGTGTRQF